MKKLIFTLVFSCSVLALFAVEPTIEFKMNEGQGSVLKPVAGKTVGRVLYTQNTKWGEGKEEGSKALYFTTPLNQRRQGGAALLEMRKQFDFSKPFTLMFNFKVAKTIPRKASCELISNTTLEKGPGFRVLLHWNHLGVFVGTPEKKRTTCLSNPNKVKVPREVWHNLAVSFDNGKAVVYFNGIGVARNEKMPAIPNQDILHVGSFSRGFAYHFNGAISDIKLFNQALTADEVLAAVKGIE